MNSLSLAPVLPLAQWKPLPPAQAKKLPALAWAQSLESPFGGRAPRPCPRTPFATIIAAMCGIAGRKALQSPAAIRQAQAESLGDAGLPRRCAGLALLRHCRIRPHGFLFFSERRSNK
jgi:hypothetical protein